MHDWTRPPYTDVFCATATTAIVAAKKRLKPSWFRQDLIILFDLLQQQKIKPLIAQRFPLAEARQAQEPLGKGGVAGKIVLVRNGSLLAS